VTPSPGRTPGSTLKRLPERARYDRETIDAILDEGLVCHVGFADGLQPLVIPVAYARVGERLLLHGSAASRMIRLLAGGTPACLTVTHLDGLVFARSGFHHSMNYRSVVVLGAAVEILDPNEKRRALDAIIDHVAPGRAAELRPASDKELRATRVLAFTLDEASAKVRVGPPKDAADDVETANGCWAGVLPLRLVPQTPVPDEHVPAGLPVPATVAGWRRPGRERG
jgi:uncharacterized protein